MQACGLAPADDCFARLDVAKLTIELATRRSLALAIPRERLATNSIASSAPVGVTGRPRTRIG
jgi:hypothetical protein